MFFAIADFCLKMFSRLNFRYGPNILIILESFKGSVASIMMGQALRDISTAA